MNDALCHGCCLCISCLCCAVCEYDRKNQSIIQRKLIDLPPLELLEKDKYNKDCYLANIYELKKYDPYNETYTEHLHHSIDTDSNIVRLIPYPNNKYQIWNTYNDKNEKINIEELKNFKGDFFFPLYWMY